MAWFLDDPGHLANCSVCHASHPHALGIELGRGQEEIMEERHVGLIGLVQLELEIPKYSREGEVELCVGETVFYIKTAGQ